MNLLIMYLSTFKSHNRKKFVFLLLRISKLCLWYHVADHPVRYSPPSSTCPSTVSGYSAVFSKTISDLFSDGLKS